MWPLPVRAFQTRPRSEEHVHLCRGSFCHPLNRSNSFVNRLILPTNCSVNLFKVILFEEEDDYVSLLTLPPPLCAKHTSPGVILNYAFLSIFIVKNLSRTTWVHLAAPHHVFTIFGGFISHVAQLANRRTVFSTSDEKSSKVSVSLSVCSTRTLGNVSFALPSATVAVFNIHTPTQCVYAFFLSF